VNRDMDKTNINYYILKSTLIVMSNEETWLS
jgi:hypothetical protein